MRFDVLYYLLYYNGRRHKRLGLEAKFTARTVFLRSAPLFCLFVFFPDALCHRLHEPHEHGGDLGPRCAVPGGQGAVAHAGDDPVHGHPAQGLTGVIGYPVRVAVVQGEGPRAGEALALRRVFSRFGMEKAKAL